MPPIAGEEARAVIEKQLGKPIAQLFASAAISQVYRAKLHSGEDVVIKVQRLGIKETIESDQQAMHYAASVLSFDPPKTCSKTLLKWS